MKSILIKAEREYEVAFEAPWRDAILNVINIHNKVLIVVSENLAALIGINEFSSAKVKVVTTPDGESSKSEEFLMQMWRECADFGLTRSDCIVAIGGGATTDVGGFVAATWLRGISWHAIPTSFAGMVDAAIGGKTGINSSSGKNLIGAFHSPDSVIIDITFLESLPDRDFQAGMAEVIKCGFIADPEILELAMNAKSNIAQLVHRSVQVKAKVVSSDFKESKLREILNYGHTLGHAVEKLEDYKLRHGEAISIGLMFAAQLSSVRGELDGETVARHKELLEIFNLPTSYSKSALPALMDLMASDKKSRGGQLRFIGLKGVGQPMWIEDVTSQQIAQAYERISQ